MIRVLALAAAFLACGTVVTPMPAQADPGDSIICSILLALAPEMNVLRPYLIIDPATGDYYIWDPFDIDGDGDHVTKMWDCPPYDEG